MSACLVTYGMWLKRLCYAALGLALNCDSFNSSEISAGRHHSHNVREKLFFNVDIFKDEKAQWLTCVLTPPDPVFFSVYFSTFSLLCVSYIEPG